MQSSSQIMIKTNINCRDRRGNCYNNKQKQSPRGLLEISEDIQENTCARVCFSIKLYASRYKIKQNSYSKRDSRLLEKSVQGQIRPIFLE